MTVDCTLWNIEKRTKINKVHVLKKYDMKKLVCITHLFLRNFLTGVFQSNNTTGKSFLSDAFECWFLKDVKNEKGDYENV